MLLFFLVRHAIHATLLAGEPASTISDAIEMFVFYAIFSFVGWLFVGLPAALFFMNSIYSKRGYQTDEQRLSDLFSMYEAMTKDETSKGAKK